MVYLLHFSRPFGHARHYTGSTTDDRLETRIREHQSGQGANLTAKAVQVGITLTLVRTWPGGRETEARFKHRNDPARSGVKQGMTRYCPLCT